MSGIVLGTDSMTLTYATDAAGQALRDATGRPIVSKQYSNARKLFEISGVPMSVMTWGVGNLGQRTAESLVLEFGLTLTEHPVNTVQAAADALLNFVRPHYITQFGTLAVAQQPVMGFWVGGYSYGSPVPEAWEFLLPQSSAARVAARAGFFGCSWRGVDAPLNRLLFGYDMNVPLRLQQAGATQELMNLFNLQTWTLGINFAAMPLQDAINFTEFALRMTIGTAEFQLGVPSCGGPLQVAVITEDRIFRWIARPEPRLRGGF